MSLLEELESPAFDGELFEQDADNNTIYTVKNFGVAQCKNPKDPSFDDWQAFVSCNYGFLRMMADKNGKLLAYTCALKLIPDPFPSRFHVGDWYVFEEYNIKQIKDFEIFIPRTIGDKWGVQWSYNAKTRCYTLVMPNAFGRTEHCFFAADNHVTSDCGDYDMSYAYNVKQTTPSKSIVELVPKILQKKNMLNRSKNIEQR